MNIKDTFAKIGNRFKKGDATQIPVLGLDIAHSYLRVTQLDQKGDEWILSKMISRSLDLQSEDVETAELELVKTIIEIKNDAKFTTDKVAVSLPITAAIVKVVNIPILKESELEVAVENGSLWTNSIQLPEDLSAYSIFWQVLAKDEAKNQMSILFVASRKQEIEKMVALIAKAGLEALVVDVRCFALRNILRVNETRHKGKINTFLEISAEENYIIFIDNGMPYIYDIFINDSDAEKIKRGEFTENDSIFYRISDQIRSSYQSFISQSGKNTIDEIVFASSLQNCTIIHEGLRGTMPEFKIVLSNPFEDIRIPANLKERIDIERNKSSFTVSLGLATRRLDVFGYFKFVTAVSNINLLPNREEKITEHKNKNNSQAILIKIASAMLVIGLIVNSILLYTSDTVGLVDRVNELQAEASKADEDRMRIEEVTNLFANVIDSQLSKNEKMLSMKIIGLLPKNIYIKTIKVSASGLSYIELYGNEPSQFSDFINTVEKSNIVSEIKMESIEFLEKTDITKAGYVVKRLAKIQFKVR